MIANNSKKIENEKDFQLALQQNIQNKFKGYNVLKEANLTYKLILDPMEKNKVKRLKYHTDILIQKKNEQPLVAIELKFKKYTSHSIITYSEKALKHKQIYPYLRYGLVIGGQLKIDNRFFNHNSGFDFAIANNNFFAQVDLENNEGFQNLIDILEFQIKSAEDLKKVFQQTHSDIITYSSQIEIKRRND